MEETGRWSVGHEWAANALAVFREQLLIPGSPFMGPRVLGVLPTVVPDEGMQALVNQAHEALTEQRAKLRTSRWCWVRSTAPQLYTPRSENVAGPQVSFLTYAPSRGSLLAQSLGMTRLPEPLLGLVVLLPVYVMQFQVRVNGRDCVVDALQPAGPDFPFEEPDGVPAVCAYSRSRDGQAGMLAARVLVGPGQSWRVGDEFADLEAAAMSRTGLPVGYAGAHTNADIVLQSMVDPSGLDWEVPLEMEVTRFPLSALLGRMVWQVAYAALIGAVPMQELAAMVGREYAAETLDAGWQAVLDDQRGDRAVFADLLTDDEAHFLPLLFVPELVDSRTPRQSEGREQFEMAAQAAAAKGRQNLVDQVRTLVSEVFAAHPHWAEER